MGLLSPTDLESSEDTVCVYVVLGTDKHGWWWDWGVTFVAISMSTAGQRGKKNEIKTEEYTAPETFKHICQQEFASDFKMLSF